METSTASSQPQAIGSPIVKGLTQTPKALMELIGGTLLAVGPFEIRDGVIHATPDLDTSAMFARSNCSRARSQCSGCSVPTPARIGRTFTEALPSPPARLYPVTMEFLA